MKKMLNTLVIALIVAGSFSCGPKVHCPGFPEHLVDYFPYKQGDTISFVNQHNDTISYWIRDSRFLENYILSPFGKSTDCSDCISPSYSIIALRLLSKSLGDELGISYNDEAVGPLIATPLSVGMKIALDCKIRSKTFIAFDLDNQYWDLDFDIDLGNSKFSFYDETGKNPFEPENSALFGDSVKFVDTNNQQINKVIIVKGQGIAEFFDQKNNFQWKSINK